MRNRDLRLNEKVTYNDAYKALEATKKYVYKFLGELDMFPKNTSKQEIMRYVASQSPKFKIQGSDIICTENNIRLRLDIKPHNKIKDKIYIDSVTLVYPEDQIGGKPVFPLTLALSPSISVSDIEKYGL